MKQCCVCLVSLMILSVRNEKTDIDAMLITYYPVLDDV
jgi:hypothetical protein